MGASLLALAKSIYYKESQSTRSIEVTRDWRTQKADNYQKTFVFDMVWIWLSMLNLNLFNLFYSLSISIDWYRKSITIEDWYRLLLIVIDYRFNDWLCLVDWAPLISKTVQFSCWANKHTFSFWESSIYLNWASGLYLTNLDRSEKQQMSKYEQGNS